MRKHLFHSILLTAAATLLLTSCGDDYDSPIDSKEFPDLEFSSDNTYQTISFGDQDLQNIYAYVEYSDGTIVYRTDSLFERSWCQPSFFGSNMRITVLENTTYEPRHAKVYVKDSESGSTISFKVTQHQNDAILPVLQEFTVPSGGQTLSFKVSTNVNITSINPLVDWIKVNTPSTSRGLVEKGFSVSVLANEDGEQRKGYVELVSSESAIVGKILVTQLSTPYIRFDTDIVEVDQNGGEVEVTVASNIDYVLDPPSNNNWLKIGARTDNGKYSYKQKLTISPMDASLQLRRCILIFRTADMRFYKELTVEQRWKDEQ